MRPGIALDSLALVVETVAHYSSCKYSVSIVTSLNLYNYIYFIFNRVCFICVLILFHLCNLLYYCIIYTFIFIKKNYFNFIVLYYLLYIYCIIIM